MSSIAPILMRICCPGAWPSSASLLLFVALALAGPLRAQERASQPPPAAPPSGAIDILVKPRTAPVDPRQIEQCEREVEAATISREIVVCREIVEDSQRYRTGSDSESEDRYARETMYANDPQAPDVAGPGIFRGPATVGGLCIPGLQKCPPPPALMVDVTALPQAPPGSDADRIARGLPPLGQDAPATVTAEIAAASAASPEESEGPVEPQ